MSVTLKKGGGVSLKKALPMSLFLYIGKNLMV